MARPVVDKKIQLDIERLFRKHPKWKAPTIRRELLVTYKEETPSSSYIRNKLKEIRDNDAKGSVLDQPWSLGSLSTYPIPYEVLPWLNWLAEDMRKNGYPITIRDVLWIARLSVLPSKDKDPNTRIAETELQWKNRQRRYIARLQFTSRNYCTYEKACERAGLVPVDTSEFDGVSLEQTEKNYNRYYTGSEEPIADEYGKPERVADRIEDAWIRFKETGNPEAQEVNNNGKR